MNLATILAWALRVAAVVYVATRRTWDKRETRIPPSRTTTLTQIDPERMRRAWRL